MEPNRHPLAGCCRSPGPGKRLTRSAQIVSIVSGHRRPGPGRIDFQHAVYDTLEPSGRPTRFQVLEVFPGRRPISREDRKYIGGIGILQVISLLTDQGRVEIAASPDSLSKLVAAPAE